MHNDEINIPDLIKIAIAHYQFETIHPFLDGNGRIGRLFIPKDDLEKKINKNLGKKSHHANLLLDHLFENPGIDVKDAIKVTNLTYKSANNLIHDFVEMGVLVEVNGKSRNRMFSFEQYLKLFEGLS